MSADFPDFDPNKSLLRYPPVLFLWFARVTTAVAYQMQAVAVGWQIYELTSSPLQLGYVGLMMFIPGVLLLLVVGHVADRYNRRRIIMAAQAVMALAVGILFVTTVAGTVTPAIILGAVFMLGAARAFEMATIQTLPPSIVPPAVLPQAIAGVASAFQAATIAGPALGGILLIGGTPLVYATCVILFFVSSTFIFLIKMRPVKLLREPPTLKTMFAGIDFVRKNPMVLGPMSLDMFAVIFGGATALLPIFARDIFQVGTWGLGVMRASPAVGAVLISIVLIRWPIRRHLGRVMYGSVAVFGLATIAFGLSTSFVFSIFALMVAGAADMMAVVIRQPMIQLETPDAMRGRVSAVNSLFSGTANQIGEFESGITAAWFGTIPSVLIGGFGTLLIVAIWIKAFPALYRFDKFDTRYKE